MRAPVLVIAVSAGLGLVLSAQVRPPGSVVAEATDRVRDRALLSGEVLADRSKVIMGTLNVAESHAYRRLERTVQAWKKEKGTGAGALLAEGVLFDCLSRLHGIVTMELGSEEPVPFFLDLAAQRPGRASKAFQAALKVDPSLTEARLRDARIRADTDLDARKQLEQLSGETGLIAYLAAMSRAETARSLNDAAGARRWYERAVALFPNAPAPRIGLAALAPGDAVPFDRLDRTDPYYSYPCVVLTAPVHAELARRMNK
jgi:hypothetical protein